jgi:hypothetical protein
MQVGLRLRLVAGRLKQVELSAVSTGIMSLFACLEDLESTVDWRMKILDSSSPDYRMYKLGLGVVSNLPGSWSLSLWMMIRFQNPSIGVGK